MHTKGPWRVDATVALGAYGVWTDCPTSPEHEHKVCSVFQANQFDLPRDQRDANARLIASAPDLLAACEELLKMTCEGGDKNFERTQMARKAVAKARGETAKGE